MLSNEDTGTELLADKTDASIDEASNKDTAIWEKDWSMSSLSKNAGIFSNRYHYSHEA